MKPRHLLLALLCAVIAYPLSIGPVVLWHGKTHPGVHAPWIADFYRPMYDAAGWSPWCLNAADAYIGLWTGHPLKSQWSSF